MDKSVSQYGLVIPSKDGLRKACISYDVERRDGFFLDFFNLNEYLGISEEMDFSIDEVKLVGSFNLGRRNLVYYPPQNGNFVDRAKAKGLINGISTALRQFDLRANVIKDRSFPFANAYSLTLEALDADLTGDLVVGKYSYGNSLIEEIIRAPLFKSSFGVEERLVTTPIIATANFYFIGNK